MTRQTRMPIRKQATAILLFLSYATGVFAQSDTQDRMSLELNDTRDENGACIITYVALNGTQAAIEKASYEIVVFGADSKVSQLLNLRFGSLSAGKSKVIPFVFRQPCSQISRILINDISECVVGNAESPICMDNLRTTTRTAIGFGL